MARRLRVGDKIRLRGKVWIVDMVNDSRAYILPLEKRHVELERPDGTPVEFEANERGLSISTYSDVEVL